MYLLTANSSGTENDAIGSFINKAYTYITTNFIGIINALLILAIGYIATKLICTILAKVLKKTKIPEVAHSIIVTLIKIALFVLVILIAASSLGIDVTGAVAIVSVVGLAVSLSVQDALKNFTGGLQIIATKPFNVGDYIIVDGTDSGTVREIGMVYTLLVTPDNRHVYIPNNQIAIATITNFSAEHKRRLDLTFSISYESDFEKAKKIIEEIIEKNLYVLHNEGQTVRVSALSANSIDIAVRVWVHRDNYWQLNFDMLEQVKTKFDEEGITIPYPQLVVTQKNDEKK